MTISGRGHHITADMLARDCRIDPVRYLACSREEGGTKSHSTRSLSCGDPDTAWWNGHSPGEPGLDLVGSELLVPQATTQQKHNSSGEPSQDGRSGARLPSGTRNLCAGFRFRSCPTLPGPRGFGGWQWLEVQILKRLQAHAVWRVLGLGSPGGLQGARMDLGTSSGCWSLGEGGGCGFGAFLG